MAWSTTLVLILSTALLAQKKDDKKQSDVQKRDLPEIVKIMDAAATGQMQNDFGLTWARADYLKAANSLEYVPFTVVYDATKVTSPSVALYWRVVAQNAGTSATLTLPAKKDDKDKDKDKKPVSKYAYENLTYITPSGGAQARLSRPFTVTAGTYDVYVMMREQSSGAKNAPPPKVAVIKQTLTVPDLWTQDLTTSSVIAASHIEPLSAPLSPNEQLERPYAALGSMEITPSLDGKFTTKDELSIFFLIYNAKTDAMNKPDVAVEYNFYSKPAGAPEKFFNKTAVQSLNASTLPKEFDMSLGHQLSTGQGVQLTSFPAGDYRLEVKVTDKLSGKSITRDVNFTVTAA
ncbi:MAG TPA: hypothetical protein VLV86_15830 [Vicinamibacterales bacterium]|nr:hypothetical protein [Vicinamibacterales bacterium]